MYKDIILLIYEICGILNKFAEEYIRNELFWEDLILETLLIKIMRQVD